MEKKYLIAGLAFIIDAPQEAFDLLWNYEPFEVPEAANHRDSGTGSAPLLYTLHVGTYPIPAEKKHVYTDCADDDMPRIEMSRVAPMDATAKEDDWLLEEAITRTTSICMQLRTRADFSEGWLTVKDKEFLKFGIDNSAMLLFAFSGLWYDCLEMHASVPVKDGKGYLFLGKSGTGKSTHSLQWHEAFPDAYLLNDDNPILRLINNTLMVYGSPWSGKTPCYKNLSAPVGGIVKIKQAPYNKARALKLPEAYAYMLSSASGLKIEPKMMDKLYEIIAKLIQMVPMLELECLPNPDAARTCYEALTTHDL